MINNIFFILFQHFQRFFHLFAGVRDNLRPILHFLSDPAQGFFYFGIGERRIVIGILEAVRIRKEKSCDQGCGGSRSDSPPRGSAL